MKKLSNNTESAGETPEISAVRRILHPDEPLSPEKEAQQAVQRIFRKIKEAERLEQAN